MTGVMLFRENYGMDFLREELGVDEEVTVKCSNYIGDTIDDAKLLGMKGFYLSVISENLSNWRQE